MTKQLDFSEGMRRPAYYMDGGRRFSTFYADITEDGLIVYPNGNLPGLADDDGMVVAKYLDMDEVEAALDDNLICNHFDLRPNKHFDYDQPPEYETVMTGQVSMHEFLTETIGNGEVLADLYRNAKRYEYLEA